MFLTDILNGVIKQNNRNEEQSSRSTDHAIIKETPNIILCHVCIFPGTAAFSGTGQ